MSYYEPIDPYAFYDQAPYSDENLLSSQLMDLYGPTSDTQAWNRINKSFPYWNEFSPDALLQADPMIRGALADAITQGEQDPYQTYSVMQSDEYQKQLADMLGKTEWNELAARGDPDSYIAMLSGDSDLREQAALDYTNNALESFFAAAAPTSQRNMGQIDFASERFGGRPYPGGELPSFSGPGFTGGSGGGMPGMPGGGGVSAGGGMAAPGATPFQAGSQGAYGGEAPIDLGEADDPTTRMVMDGPEGYQRVVVLRGHKFALPDSLPGPSGVSPGYMQALRSRAREMGVNNLTPGKYRPMDDDDGGGDKREGNMDFLNRLREKMVIWEPPSFLPGFG